MNPSEQVAYNYLIEIGYKPKDIKFQQSRSPDFITIDGMQWECKFKNENGKINFSYDQQSIHPSTRVLIVNRNMKCVENVEFFEALNYKHKHAFFVNRKEFWRRELKRGTNMISTKDLKENDKILCAGSESESTEPVEAVDEVTRPRNIIMRQSLYMGA